MRKTMRNKMTKALVALSAVCLLGAVGKTATVAYADATTATVSEVAFSMQEGASVRLNADGKNGLRYGITMSDTDYAKLMNNVGENKAYSALSFGILLAPASYETDTITLREDTFGGDKAFYWAEKNSEGEWEIPAGTVTTDKKQIMNFESAGMVTDEDNANMMRYYGSMVGIKDSNRTVDFVGVGYIKYVEGGVTKYFFAEDNDNTRSIAYVASKALNDESKDFSAYNETLTKYIQGALGDNTALAFTEASVNVAAGKTAQLSLNATTALDVEYTSNDQEVATVDSKGVVTGVSAGEATITAKIGELFSCETTVTVADNRTRDELLAETYVPDARAELNYMHAVGQVSVKSTEGSALTMPVNFAGSSYLQYDITNESTLDSGNYHGYAIAMDSGKYPINENLLDKFSVTDWSNAYVGFWVYNDSSYTLNMYAQHEINFGAADTESKEASKAGWTYVEWKLTDFNAIYTTNPFELESYFLRIGFGFRSTGITTIGGLKATFYIAGFDIYDKTRDDLLAETYVPDARAELDYMHAVGQVSVKSTEGSALTMPVNFAGSSYLQYDITNESTLSSGNYHGYAIAMDSGKYPINKDLLAKFSVTDWSDAYVGFWVYNDSSYTLNMYAQHEANFSATGTESVTTEKGAWTYVEWKLTDFNASYTSNPFELEKYFLRIGFGFRGTGITTEGDLKATFYIADFDIYTESKAA